MCEKYRDILDLPHHVSKTRPPMSREDRAAQFSPFAALTGYEDTVREAGRLTEGRIELDEDALEAIDRKLRALQAQDRPEVRITRFCPDRKKAGGSYETLRGIVCKIDVEKGILSLENGRAIPLDSIVDLDPVCQKD